MTLYEVLGVSPSASPEEIESAYKKLALDAHPDREGGSTERMQELNSARDILLDPARRRLYDASGEATSAQDIRSIARETLISGFISHIEKGLPSGTLSTMRFELESALSFFSLEKAKAEDDLRKIEKKRRKVILRSEKKGEEEDLFSLALEGIISKKKAQLISAMRQVEVSSLVLTLLSSYEEGKDPSLTLVPSSRPSSRETQPAIGEECSGEPHAFVRQEGGNYHCSRCDESSPPQAVISYYATIRRARKAGILGEKYV